MVFHRCLSDSKSPQFSGTLFNILADLNNIIIIIIPCKLADGFSPEFEWQQVSSSLQDSSQYSGWSQ